MAERPPSNPFGPSDLIYGVKDPTPQDIADVINDYSGVVSDAAILTQERLDIFARKNVEKGEVAENQRSSSAWGKGWENFGIELGYDPPSRDLQIFINEVIGAPERGVGDRIFDAGPDSIDFQRTVQNVLNRRQQLQSEQSTLPEGPGAIMADEPTSKPSRFWVQYLPVNDAYIVLLGDTYETASRIPLRHPEIPALGKRLNVTTPMDRKYGRERWEQLPKEQTLFSSLEEIDATLAKSGFWRDPQTNDIVGIENRPPPSEPRPTDKGPGERLIQLRQAAEGITPLEDVVAPPTTPPMPPMPTTTTTPPVPRLATDIQKRGRGLIRNLGRRFRIAQSLQQVWKSLPEETQAEILTTVQISPSEMEQINQLPHWPEIGSPLSPELADLIVAKIDEVGEKAWDWFEGLVGGGEEPAKGPTFTEAEISVADTARSRGAIGPRALVPRTVREVALSDDTILDFGSGPEEDHAQKLREDGFNVTAWDFGKNPEALQRQYDIVYASNVLNVQSSLDMLERTVSQIANSVRPGGTFIGNLPLSPRKSQDLNPQTLETILSKYFTDIKRVGGKRNAPVYTAKKASEEPTGMAQGGLVQGPFPRATSRFAAHAGFVDKPLYSRS